MKIAIPTENGRLHGHFGGCREFTIVEIHPESKSVERTEVLPAPEHQPGAFPRWLGQLGVRTVIAGGIGHRALENFARQGIAVRAGVPEATAEQLVAALLEGRLEASPAGCDHHGQGEDHGHHHGDHHHHHHHHHHLHGNETETETEAGRETPAPGGVEPGRS